MRDFLALLKTCVRPACLALATAVMALASSSVIAQRAPAGDNERTTVGPGAAKRPGPAIYRMGHQIIEGTVTDPCGDFSIGLNLRKKNCTPVTRRTTRSEKRPVYYDVHGFRDTVYDWMVDKPDEIVADPTITVAPMRGLYEVTTTGTSNPHGPVVKRLCLDSVAAIEALFQAHRGAHCQPPAHRLVTSDYVEIAGRCGPGGSKVGGRYDIAKFELHTQGTSGPGPGGSIAVVVTGRRLSPSCAAPAEPRW